VRTREYAGGGSIDVRVTAVPAGFKVQNPARMYMDLCRVDSARPYFTPEAAAVLRKLDALLQAYNRDDSDSMVDHFDVRFYGDAGFEWQLEAAERATYKAAFEAALAAGTLADPGEDFSSALDYREEVERLSEMAENPASDSALAAVVAAKALGATLPRGVYVVNPQALIKDAEAVAKAAAPRLASMTAWAGLAARVSAARPAAPATTEYDHEACLAAAGLL